MRHACMFIWVALCALFLAAPAARAADDHVKLMEEMRAKEEHVGVWQRYPVVGIPLIAEEPKIDGVVDTREWFAAARLGRMVDYIQGLAVRDQTDILLAYSKTHLYIAFIFERPESSRAPSDQDKVELLFDLPHTHAKYHNLGANVNQVMWTGVGPNVVKSAWQPKVEYKAHATDIGWEGELAIPFTEFNLQGPPEPGATWGADFVRNEHTPLDRLAVWAFRGSNWHAVGNLGHMIFTGQPVSVRVEDSGWMVATRQAGAKLLISNFGKEPAVIDAFLELRRAAEPVKLQFYPQIATAMAEELPAAIGSPLKQEVEAALKPYAVLKTESKQVTVGAGRSELVQLAVPDDPGNYLVSFSARQGTTPLAGGLTPAEITVPLAIKIESYLLSAQVLAYEVDLRRMGEKVTAGSKMALRVTDGAGAVKAEQTIEGIAGKPNVTGSVNFKPDFEATYTLTATILEGSTVVAQNQESLRLPAKPVWWANDLGKKKFVPEPFVPLVATERTVQVLCTKYEWQPGELFPRFGAFNKEVFAAPITLRIKDAAGTELPVKVTSWKLKSSDIEHADFAFSGTLADKADIDGTVGVEFDGLAWYTLNIKPKAPLELSSAVLEFTLKKECARYCTVGAAGTDTVYSGMIPPEGLQKPFSFSYWLGGIEGGVQWFGQNERNWYNAKAKNVTEIRTDEKAGHLHVKFIDRPVTLSAPIDWSFGFIPTPSRIKAKNWGKFAFFQTGGLLTLPKEAPTEELKKNDPSVYHKVNRNYTYYNGPGWKRDKTLISAIIAHGYWNELFGYPGTYDSKRLALLAESVPWMHSMGMKSIVYAGWGVNTDAPEWKDFGNDMVRLPLYNSGYSTYRQCPTTLWQDWFVYKMAQMIKEHDIDGIFIDSAASPMITENYTPGMRWTDDTGKTRGSYPILASREWMKRLYKLWHGELKNDGIIYNHNSPPAIMAIETFTDVRCPSEFAQTHPGEFDQQFVDYFIAKNTGEQFGIFVELTNKDWMGDWAKKKTSQIYAVALPLNVSFKAVNLHDSTAEFGNYNPGTQMMAWIWQASAWVDRSTAQYLPWWKNSAYLQTTPADDRVIHALWLQKSDRALLCLSNLAAQPRKIEVQLNAKELGFTPANVVDAITGEVIPVSDSRLSVDVDFERFRLLKVMK